MLGLNFVETEFGSAVMLAQLQGHADDRGILHSLELVSLPFVPQRIFFVQSARAGQVRGGHAHKTAHQMFICTSGQIEVLVAHGSQDRRFPLDHPGKGLYLRPLVWSEQTYLSAGATLLVLSSESYDPASYLLDRPTQDHGART